MGESTMRKWAKAVVMGAAVVMVGAVTAVGQAGPATRAAGRAGAAGRGDPNAGSAATNPGSIKGWAAGYEREVAGVKPIIMNLWEGEVPSAGKAGPTTTIGGIRAERNDGERIWEVSTPGVLVYLPSKEQRAASGTPNALPCVVECMGGSYTHLTRLVGGDRTVEPFLARGIAVVALKYRVRQPITGVEEDAVLDGMRAMRLVRARAAAWGIDKRKVGMMGWSAGGNLIVSLVCNMPPNGAGDETSGDPVERESCRPDFAVLWSPWPNAKTNDAYQAKATKLGLPPLLIGGAKDDKTAPYVFVSGVAAMWKAAGGDVEMLTQETGGHGAYEANVGTGGDWPEKFYPWLEKHGFWKK